MIENILYLKGELTVHSLLNLLKNKVQKNKPTQPYLIEERLEQYIEKFPQIYNLVERFDLETET